MKQTREIKSIEPLSDEREDYVITKILQCMCKKELDKLYDSSYYNLCDIDLLGIIQNKSTLFFVIKDINGRIFGSYNSRAPHSYNSCMVENQHYLFALNNRRNLFKRYIYKCKPNTAKAKSFILPSIDSNYSFLIPNAFAINKNMNCELNLGIIRYYNNISSFITITNRPNKIKWIKIYSEN